MSKFRLGESDQFPVDRKDNGVWYGIIILKSSHEDVTVGGLTVSFTSSGSGKRELVDMISELKLKGISYLLLGIWQGQYSTDIFVLDEKIIVRRILDVMK
jgi:hypothetical protein